MVELARDRMDFHPLRHTAIHTESPTMQSSSGIICQLQPILTSLINITTTDKILVGLRIQMDPGCEFYAAFRLLLQSKCIECQCVIGVAGEIMGRVVPLGLKICMSCVRLTLK